MVQKLLKLFKNYYRDGQTRQIDADQYLPANNRWVLAQVEFKRMDGKTGNGCGLRRYPDCWNDDNCIITKYSEYSEKQLTTS